MIRFRMEFYDVLFPVSLNALTYRCPETLSNVVRPGMLVSAPLKKKISRGVIVGKSPTVPSGDVKEIQKVHGETAVLSGRMINLLRWMAEYYLTDQGLALKSMLPREAFTRVKQRKTGKDGTSGISQGNHNYSVTPVDISDGAICNPVESINKGIYGTFLLHAPSSLYEYSFLIKILSETGNAIVLIPEVSLIDKIYPPLSRMFGERICLFHGGLSRGRKSEAIERIQSGNCDIVLGTRSAVFVPLKKVSFIAVLQEHSNSYKQESSPCYSGRDVAVKRGYFERATVLLSSICPSIESLYNSRSGKYTLLKPEADIKKPKLRILDMRYEKLLKPYLSEKVVAAATKCVGNDKKVMFVINRRGYSTLLQCTDCNYIEECPDCRIPLVFHKQDMSLKCHYCGYLLSGVPDNCGRCKGYNMKLLGAGTQRIQEDIEKLIGLKTLRLDSDKKRKISEIEGLTGDMGDNIRMIVGTKLMTRRLGITRGFSMAAILNTDLLLNLPDFRSAEKAYQEISSIIDKIEPSGEIYVQTRMPQNYLFKYLKSYDYVSFFSEELHRRRSLNYPPYSKLLLIKFTSKRDISKDLSELIGRGEKDPEIIGPSLSRNARGRQEFRLLLRSSNPGKLHSAARTVMNAFKNSRDITIRTDIDPISI